MNEYMQETMQLLFAKGKGILAADESIPTAGKRLAAVGMENTEENRQAYRRLFFEAPLEEAISGVILHEETLTQAVKNSLFGKAPKFTELLQEKGVVIGIKGDEGLQEVGEGEWISQGLESFSERLAEYKKEGARFAKWRSAFRITEELPTEENIRENAEILAGYARICQDQGIVPMVEPEVLMDGAHSMATDEDITHTVLEYVFDALREEGVDLSLVILKINMTLPGFDSEEEVEAEDVAATVWRMFDAVLPSELGGVVFLSGGQSSGEAIARLEAIMKEKGERSIPMTFSYARALQGDALKVWRGEDAHIEEAQHVFMEQCKAAVKALGRH